MKIELADKQVKDIVEDYLHSVRDDQDEKKRLALVIFQRSERVDFTTVLRAVVRQCARQHNMNVKHVLKELS